MVIILCENALSVCQKGEKEDLACLPHLEERRKEEEEKEDTHTKKAGSRRGREQRKRAKQGRHSQAKLSRAGSKSKSKRSKRTKRGTKKDRLGLRFQPITEQSTSPKSEVSLPLTSGRPFAALAAPAGNPTCLDHAGPVLTLMTFASTRQEPLIVMHVDSRSTPSGIDFDVPGPVIDGSTGRRTLC